MNTFIQYKVQMTFKLCRCHYGPNNDNWNISHLLLLHGMKYHGLVYCSHHYAYQVLLEKTTKKFDKTELRPRLEVTKWLSLTSSDMKEANKHFMHAIKMQNFNIYFLKKFYSAFYYVIVISPEMQFWGMDYIVLPTTIQNQYLRHSQSLARSRKKKFIFPLSDHTNVQTKYQENWNNEYTIHCTKKILENIKQ